MYSRCDLAVCDDVLSGLDSTTEDVVVRRIFSASGLFTKTGTPVILATHSSECWTNSQTQLTHPVKHMPMADLIVALDSSGQIIAQGKYEDVVSASQYASKLGEFLDQDDSTSGETGADETAGDAEAPKAKEADNRRKKGNWKTYKFYFIDVLSGWRLVLFLGFAAANVTFDALLSELLYLYE